MDHPGSILNLPRIVGMVLRRRRFRSPILRVTSVIGGQWESGECDLQPLQNGDSFVRRGDRNKKVIVEGCVDDVATDISLGQRGRDRRVDDHGDPGGAEKDGKPGLFGAFFFDDQRAAFRLSEGGDWFK